MSSCHPSLLGRLSLERSSRVSLSNSTKSDKIFGFKRVFSKNRLFRPFFFLGKAISQHKGRRNEPLHFTKTVGSSEKPSNQWIDRTLIHPPVGCRKVVFILFFRIVWVYKRPSSFSLDALFTQLLQNKST
jgi:hypothetical protein